MNAAIVNNGTFLQYVGPVVGVDCECDDVYQFCVQVAFCGCTEPLVRVSEQSVNSYNEIIIEGVVDSEKYTSDVSNSVSRGVKHCLATSGYYPQNWLRNTRLKQLLDAALCCRSHIRNMCRITFTGNSRCSLFYFNEQLGFSESD